MSLARTGVIGSSYLPQFSPIDIAGLVFWVKANSLSLSDGDPVSTWADQSGNSNDVTQATGSAQPTYETNIQNGLPIVRFDGSADFMECANTSIVTNEAGMSVFIIAKQASLATDAAYLAKWDFPGESSWGFQTDSTNSDEVRMFFANTSPDGGGNHQSSTDADLTTAFYLIEFIYDGSLSGADRIKIYRNGTLLSVSTSGTFNATLTTSTATMKLGKFGGILDRFYNGDIGEVLLYNNAVSGADRALIENYLIAKWGL